jgi:hypothetical protein
MTKFIQFAKQILLDRTDVVKKRLKKAFLNRALQQEPEIDYPELRPGDVESARLFATRSSMVEAFRPLLQGKR